MNPLRWRKMTWVLNVWNVIFLIWIIAGSVSGANQANKDCSHPGILTRQECLDASHAGTGIGVALIFFLWFLGFVVISIIWFMTRRKGRICPHCGEDVKKGLTACKKCGYDFTTGTNPNLVGAAPSATPISSDSRPLPDRQRLPFPPPSQDAEPTS